MVEEKLAREDQEMESMDCFVDMIHMAYRKLKYLHYFLWYMRGLGLNSYMVEKPDASWVPVGVHPMVEGKQ
jgi:hypothetical protein